MNDLFQTLSKGARDRLRKRRQPAWMAPMLATLTDDYFSSKDWLFERKLDGERCLAFRNGSKVRLLSRNKKLLNETYPELIEAFEHQESTDIIADGEITAFENGVTSFSRLQKRMQIQDAEKARNSGVAVYFYLFDLLHFDGHDTTQLALRDRKSLLRQALSFEKSLRFTMHRNTDGEAFLKEACKKGWEGLIAKRADATYTHGRSRDWLKFKCSLRQEFVVGGFTDPKGERIGFGALLVGFYEGKNLRYAGMVGTGYDDATLRSLKKKLDALEEDGAPFSGSDLPTRSVHWVRPKVVAEVGFTEWTDDGKLRHPRFLGLRDDKSPKEVRREAPKGQPAG